MKKPKAKAKKAPAPAASKVKAKPAGGLAIDKAAIRDLAKLLDETGLTEITWSHGATQVKVAKGGTGGYVQQAPVAAGAPATVAAAPAASEDDPAKHPGAVKSPMVGTAYVAPEPGAPNFVRVGDTVKQGQTLIIVEAMKTMNPIPSPKAGRIARIMIEDKQPVEFGQVLMLIE